MKIRLLSIVLTALVAGCTPDAYQRDADLQVNKLLADRKETTLGYSPKTEVSNEPVTAPTPKSYASIPTTPIAPEAPSPVEPTHTELRYERLGPPAVEHGDGIGGDRIDLSDMHTESEDRLRLGPPSAGTQAVVQVDLFRALQYGVQHSREYQDAVEDVYLRALEVTTQRHMFEPQPFANVSGEWGRDRNGNNNTSALTGEVNAGVLQNLPLGGNVRFAGVARMVNVLGDSLNNGESAQLAVTASIPLLRGAGMVNLEGLIQSERQLIYSIRAFEDFRRRFAVDVSSQYFSLLSQQKAIENRRRKYMSSTDLTTRTRELYVGGKQSFLEVQRSLQTALTDENNLIGVEQAYENQLDDFKIKLGIPLDQNVDVQAVELDVEAPSLDPTSSEALALKYRLDLQTAKDRIEDARRRVDNARNGLLPDLDLDLAGSLGSTNAQPSSGPSPVLLNDDNYSYSARLNLGLPLDRLTERNDYRRSLILFQVALRAFENTRENVRADVRDATRRLRLAQTTLDIQRRAIELAQRRLDYSGELLTQSKATAREVVEAQADLLNAQDNYELAKATLQIQILTFLRVTGTLRLQPDSGTLARTMDVASTGLTEQIHRPGAIE